MFLLNFVVNHSEMKFTTERMTFDRVPDAVAYLIKQVEDLRSVIDTRLENKEAPTEELKFDGNKALAQYLNCSVQTVHALKRRKAITFHRMGRRCYYLRSEIDRDLAVQPRKFGK